MEGTHILTKRGLSEATPAIIRNVAYVAFGVDGFIEERTSFVVEFADGQFATRAPHQCKRDLGFYEGEGSDPGE